MLCGNISLVETWQQSFSEKLGGGAFGVSAVGVGAVSVGAVGVGAVNVGLYNWITSRN